MSQERTPRTMETREEKAQPMPWEPTSTLPDPDPVDGWVFRWNRSSLMNEEDNRNMSKRLRSGWVPCKMEDHPELALVMSDHNSEWAKKGAIEVGGLLLCKAPAEMLAARSAYFSRMAEGQMEAVDNTLMSQNSPGSHGMTIDKPSRKTKVTFGSG